MPSSQSDVIIKINNNNSNEGSIVCGNPIGNTTTKVPEINKAVSRTDFYNKLNTRFAEDA